MGVDLYLPVNLIVSDNGHVLNIVGSPGSLIVAISEVLPVATQPRTEVMISPEA